MTDLKLINVALVASGGAAGAVARMLAGHYLRPLAAGGLPWPTFAINVSGCFMIGLLTAVVGARAPQQAGVWNHALGIGFLGAYTTFSTFELETHNLAAGGRTGAALIYILLSVAAGYGALKLGLLAGR